MRGGKIVPSPREQPRPRMRSSQPDVSSFFAVNNSMPAKPQNNFDRYFAKPARSQSIATEDTSSAGLASRPMMLSVLKKHYNQTGHEDSEFDSEQAVLQRESLRFHPEVRASLTLIWEWTDDDRSGNVDLAEYTRMFITLCEC